MVPGAVDAKLAAEFAVADGAADREAVKLAVISYVPVRPSPEKEAA